MNRLKSYADFTGLINILNATYQLGLSQIHLHREMIGHVYFAEAGTSRYVLKLYRPNNTSQALQSIEIIQYLNRQNYPVAPIIPAEDSRLHIDIAGPDGDCTGILFSYIQGKEPELETEITQIGEQTGELHKLMQEYTKPLIRRGKEFYIDRYIDILAQMNYSPERIKELSDYGSELWSRMEKLPNGFCHGDLHSGNIIQNQRNYYLFDFDIASDSYSVIDVAALSNKTNFNRLEESAYADTIRMFERFYAGYSRKRSLSNAEIACIFDFIPIRHYELIATITECQGLNGLKQSFLDQQYVWLMQWRTIAKSL